VFVGKPQPYGQDLEDALQLIFPPAQFFLGLLALGDVDVDAQDAEDFRPLSDRGDDVVKLPLLTAADDQGAVLGDDLASKDAAVVGAPVLHGLLVEPPAGGRLHGQIAPQADRFVALHDDPLAGIAGPEIKGQVAQHGLEQGIHAHQGLLGLLAFGDVDGVTGQ